jgi:ribonuclease R
LESPTFYPAVIRSRNRLTYTSVRKVLVDQDGEERTLYRDILPDLELMEELAQRLTKKRHGRGSIDFDLPEPQIILNLRGETEAIIRSERNLAHRIIEEFMLAANEAVATHLERREVPALYRVHEPPDPVKLNDFQEFIFNFGYRFALKDDRVEPAELQRLLAEAEGKPEERMVNEVLLRCMKQARYSAENLGHFGLAATTYTHFTSPIRRYPDLVVHRILMKLISGTLTPQDRERLEQTLPETASHTSKRERTAMEAEREVVDLKKVQFMMDKVGEEFDGIITGVSNYGFFVELVDLFVEGMVPIASLGRDYYRFDPKQHLLRGERTGGYFRIGDRVKVRLARVILERKQLEFALAALLESRPAGQAAQVEEGEYLRQPVRGKRPPQGKGRPGAGQRPPGKGGDRGGAGRKGGKKRR